MKGNLTIQSLCHKAGKALKHHAPTILTVISAAGVIATAVVAVKETPKAIKLLEEAKEEKGEELTKLETVKVAAPIYIPAALIGVSTIACIFGSNVLNKRQQATLVSAYALVDQTYKEYTNKVKELYGEEADKKVREEIKIDKRNRDISAYAPGVTNVDLSGDDCLFYNESYGGYFQATMTEVLNAEYHLNRNLQLKSFVSVDEFFQFLGLNCSDYISLDCGELLGWAIDDFYDSGLMPWIDFNHRKVELDGGMVCYIIEPVYDPTIHIDEC